MEIRSKEISIVPIKKLKKKRNNRNKHPQEQIEALAKHFEYQGFRNPLIVSNQSGEIVCGHGRYLAAIRAGLKEVPVIYQDFDSPEQEYSYHVADNGLSLWAELDLSGINSDLGDLGPDFNIDWLGIKDFTLDAGDKEFLTDPDEIPEVVEPKAKLGQIYKLGEHRLMCGDSTRALDVEKLMDGESAEILFTSPPYSDMREYNGSKDLSVCNIVQFIKTFSEYCSYQVINLGIQTKDREVVQYWDEYIKTAKDSGLKFMAWNVWHKTAVNVGQQKQFFPLYHEWVFVFGLEAKKLNLTEKKKTGSQRVKSSAGRRQKDGSIKFSSKGDQSSELKMMESVFKSNPELGSIRSKHPATFPVELPTQYIKAMTRANDFVVDPFCGSGTTLIACEKLSRKCFGMELDPHYIDVIIARWEKFTNKKAELIS